MKKYIFLIILIGILIRVHGVSDFHTSNTVAFNYERAKYIVETGTYKKYDSLSYSPETFKEDYPPFTYLFSTLIYLPFLLLIDHYIFITYYPIIMYVLICISGYYIFKNLFNNRVGLFFCGLFSILPVTSFLTKKGFYTQESTGILLILLFVYFFIKSLDIYKYKWITIFILTFLTITWQSFLILLFGVIIFAIFYQKNFIYILLLILIPFLLGHIIAFNLIGIEYSPINVLKETYIGYQNKDTENFKIALHRGKLRSYTVDKYIMHFTILSIILPIFGLYHCFINRKNSKYLFILIMGIFSISLLLIYMKFKYLAALFIIILSSIGLNYLYKIDIKNLIKISYLYIENIRKKYF